DLAGFESEMDESAFAEALGFDTFEDLMAASESVVREGDIDWYVTALAAGRWAAWDDAELSRDRAASFETREEAEWFRVRAYAEQYGEEDYSSSRLGGDSYEPRNPRACERGAFLVRAPDVVLDYQGRRS